MFDLKDRLKDFDVILASASPRRKELFSFICDDYKIIPAVKDEVVDNSLEVTEIPKVLAYNKCREIAEQNPDSLIYLLSLMLSPLSLCTIIGSFFLFDFSKIWTHRKLPEAAAKIYHVKGSIPVSFTHITD